LCTKFDSTDIDLSVPIGAYLPAAIGAQFLSSVRNNIINYFPDGVDILDTLTNFGVDLTNPGTICSTTYIRSINILISWFLALFIWIFLRDVTFNPLYPTLSSITKVQHIVNTSTQLFFAECLIVVQALIIWHLPLSSFFYTLSYPDTISLLSLVLVALFSRRLTPFFSCEDHNWTPKLSFLRFFLLFPISLWSVAISPKNVTWIGFIIAINILQYVYHEFYFNSIKPSTYPLPPKQSKNDQNKPKFTQPVQPGTETTPLTLPNFENVPFLSFPQSMKGFVMALFNPFIFLRFFPHFFAILSSLFLFPTTNSEIIETINHQGISGLNWAQIPFFLSFALLLFPYFSKIPINFISTTPRGAGDIDAEPTTSHNGPIGSSSQPNAEKKKSLFGIVMMVIGHIVGIYCICYGLFKALEVIYPHPLLVNDNRHYSHYIYTFLNKKLFQNVQQFSPLFSDFFPTITHYIPQIITLSDTIKNLKDSILSDLSSLNNPHLDQLLQTIPQTLTSLLNFLNNNTNTAQLILVPLSLHTLYLLISTNPLPAFIWLIFSSLFVAPNMLIDFSCYIPILFFAFSYIQHREGNFIIKVVFDYQELSVRVLVWMIMITLFIVIHFFFTKVFIFGPFVSHDGDVFGRLVP
jgi:hypothetical protein